MLPSPPLDDEVELLELDDESPPEDEELLDESLPLEAVDSLVDVLEEEADFDFDPERLSVL